MSKKINLDFIEYDEIIFRLDEIAAKLDRAAENKVMIDEEFPTQDNER